MASPPRDQSDGMAPRFGRADDPGLDVKMEARTVPRRPWFSGYKIIMMNELYVSAGRGGRVAVQDTD